MIRNILQAGKFQALCPLLQVPCRSNTSKHYDIKWREHRKRKVIKVNLFDFDKMRKDQNKNLEERRDQMKKEKQMPPRQFQEIPLNIASTSTVFEPYVPPEGDGKMSLISKEGAKQRIDVLSKKGKSFRELRKIKKYEDVDAASFAEEAQEIYKQAHELLCSFKDKELDLRELVTEKAYTEMTHGLGASTLQWRLSETIEPARVVHVRTTDVLSKTNIYAQITVRIHTKQVLAVFDRFGRLMYGDRDDAKDVLEYVVFEKHISNLYGRWKLHAKIAPAWRKVQDMRGVVTKTYKLPDFESKSRDDQTSSDLELTT